MTGRPAYWPEPESPHGKTGSSLGGRVQAGWKLGWGSAKAPQEQDERSVWGWILVATAEGKGWPGSASLAAGIRLSCCPGLARKPKSGQMVDRGQAAHLQAVSWKGHR